MAVSPIEQELSSDFASRRDEHLDPVEITRIIEAALGGTFNGKLLDPAIPLDVTIHDANIGSVTFTPLSCFVRPDYSK